MGRVMWWQVGVVVAALVALVGVAPATLLAGPADQKGLAGPDIAELKSAQFDLKGFVKVDGITVDVTGSGSMAPPDQLAAKYKFGPFTLETVITGGNTFVRSGFDPKWEVSETPREFPMNTGPIALSEVLPRGPYALLGQERVDGKLTSKWSSELDLSLLLALADAAPSSEPQVRDTLATLKANLEVWVGNDDRQLYKERLLVTFTIPPIEPQGDPLPGTIDMTLQYSKHNQAVSIQAPTTERPRRRGINFPLLKPLQSLFETTTRI